MKRKFHVIGASHIDLAWKKNSEEMSELLEAMVVRLLDILDRCPEFTYVLEQADLYKNLSGRRPDLIDRLKYYIQEGRLEIAGGMASTPETNIPCGESFVRNQILGFKWFRENLGAEITTGWLMDAFGINAQVPQILQQFGLKSLMADRLGGKSKYDAFIAVGLDGSEVLVAGHDLFSPYIKNMKFFFEFTQSWADIDRVFETAKGANGPGPFLIMPYIENELLPSTRVFSCVESFNRTNSENECEFSLPFKYFNALEEIRKSLPVEFADLNPEFTGTFSQRVEIRLLNRRIENLLLEAEKWAVLTLVPPDRVKPVIDDAWWKMAFIHSHDVLTGSHPTKVLNETLERFEKVEESVVSIGNMAFAPGYREVAMSDGDFLKIAVLNGLPWDRRDMVSFPAGNDVSFGLSVTCMEKEIPSDVKDGRLRFMADLPAVGVQSFEIRKNTGTLKPNCRKVQQAVIENEYIRLEVSEAKGLEKLVWKNTDEVLLENVGDFLVVQKDEGNFQFEMPTASELPVSAREFGLSIYNSTPIGQCVRLEGSIPKPGCKENDDLMRWVAEFSLIYGKPKLDISLDIEWMGEQSRLRFKLPTTIDTSEGIFEIPFGVVTRKPYVSGHNKKGEWPAQRFAAIEDGNCGIALVNLGVQGVEVNGGTMWTTLLRAPKCEYGGMKPDDTSSQHGCHNFKFALVPYEGSWKESQVLTLSQEFNFPLQVISGFGHRLLEGKSYIKIDRMNVVLSAVKIPEDGTDGEMIIRLYETAGLECEPRLFIREAEKTWLSDLQEAKLEPAEMDGEQVKIYIKPFEIKTLRVKKRIV